MNDKSIDDLFDIVSHPKFLKMQGLSNEVPFFIHTYNIKNQAKAYKQIESLIKRLSLKGVDVCKIGLYDMVLEHFRDSGDWADVLEHEREVGKKEFHGDLVDALGADEVIKPYFRKKLAEDEYKIIFLYQVGEVFPYLRTHNVLNYLQSVVQGVPLVVFFPGDYVTSYESGFSLKLFDIDEFEDPYYRAFKLEDYKIRENLDGSA